MKQNILVMCDNVRPDHLQPFVPLKDKANFYFLRANDSRKTLENWDELPGKMLWTKNFTSAQQVLNEIKAEKILFFSVDSYVDILFNLAAKELNIPTFHMEHGVRFYEFRKARFEAGQETLKAEKRNLFSKLKRITLANIKNKIFRKNSINMLSKPAKEEFWRCCDFMQSYGPNYGFMEVGTPEALKLQHYIAFSRESFAYHKKFSKLGENAKVHYVGIPHYDAYSACDGKENREKTIIFIDQPYEKTSFSGWSSESKKTLINDISLIAKQHGFDLLIKKHPNSLEEAFPESINALSEEEFRDRARDCPIILGFCSTLLLPFMAMENKIVLCLDMKEYPLYGMVDPLVETGAAQRISHLQELSRLLASPALFQQSLAQLKGNKKDYIEKWLFKFDGKSQERFEKLLLSDSR